MSIRRFHLAAMSAALMIALPPSPPLPFPPARRARRLHGATTAAATAAATTTATYPTWDGKQETVRYTTQDLGAPPVRSYTQATTMRVREGGKQDTQAPLSYQELRDARRPAHRAQRQPGLRRPVRAGGPRDEAGLGQEIRDGNYNGNNPIPCDCFETGEKWHYVWTRDLSYAADLGLAMLDPQRVRNSLLNSSCPAGATA
jgi:hypothetical protein